MFLPGCFASVALAGCVSPATASHAPASAVRIAIPARARVATLVETKYHFASDQAPTVIGTVTVTDPAKVRQVVAYLNGLTVNPLDSSWSCPQPSGNIAVTFSARPGGPALATASAGIGGCAILTCTVPGEPPIWLGGGAAGDNLLNAVDRVTGLHWTIPPSPL
jgi:hypothetical protein